MEKPREIFCDLARIQIYRGPVGIAFSRNTWFMRRNSVNVQGQPTYCLPFGDVGEQA